MERRANHQFGLETATLPAAETRLGGGKLGLVLRRP
jgi:hypothetical protein